MTDIPTLGQSPAQATAMIPLCIARHEIASQMGPAIREVFSVLAAQGLRPARVLSSRWCRTQGH